MYLCFRKPESSSKKSTKIHPFICSQSSSGISNKEEIACQTCVNTKEFDLVQAYENDRSNENN